MGQTISQFFGGEQTGGTLGAGQLPPPLGVGHLPPVTVALLVVIICVCRPTYPEGELGAGPVAYLEVGDRAEEVQGTVGDFRRMTKTVPIRNATDYHIGVSYCLHLQQRVLSHKRTWN